MKFYGHGIAYLGERCKVKFKKNGGGFQAPGIYETEDANIAEKLTALGYKSDGEIVVKKAPIKRKRTPAKKVIPETKEVIEDVE